MTDLELQRALAGELKKMCETHSLKKLDGEDWKAYNIYSQDKPYKDDEDDKAQEDYIIVLLDDEETFKDEAGKWKWKVCVQFIISIELYDESNQGNLILANLMNQIDSHFRKHCIVGGCCTMDSKSYKKFNHECYEGFYESALITYWEFPVIEPEWIDEETMEGIGEYV